MATIHYIDDEVSSARLLYSAPSVDLCEYVTQQVNHYASAVGGVIPSTVEYVMSKYNEFTNSNTIRYVEALKYKIDTFWDENAIRHLNSIGLIQQAPEVMQKYIMAMPRLRTLHQNGGLSAYGDSYVDKYEGKLEKNHYDYRRVTDTVVIKTLNGNYESTQYLEPNAQPEDMLSMLQRASVFATWATIDQHLDSDNNSDPTSTWNETM